MYDTRADTLMVAAGNTKLVRSDGQSRTVGRRVNAEQLSS